MILTWLLATPALSAEPMTWADLDHCAVIGLGEATHGGAAEVRARTRITQELVERGAELLILEAGVAEGFAAQDHRSAGRTRQAVDALGYWTWRAEELVEALDGLADVPLVGVDVQTPEVAAERLVDAEGGEALVLRWTMATGVALGPPGSRGYGRRRDRAMSEAAVAWLGSNGPQRAVLWAHNGHVGRERARMGRYLHRTLGKDYCAVGLVVGGGSTRVMQTDGRIVVVDIPAAPEPSLASRFAGQPEGLYAAPSDRLHLAQVGVFLTGRDWTKIRANKVFDAVYYLPETGPTHPLGTAASPVAE